MDDRILAELQELLEMHIKRIHVVSDETEHIISKTIEEIILHAHTEVMSRIQAD